MQQTIHTLSRTPLLDQIYEETLDDNFDPIIIDEYKAERFAYPDGYFDEVRRIVDESKISLKRGDLIEFEDSYHLDGAVYIKEVNQDNDYILCSPESMCGKGIIPREFADITPVCYYWGNPYLDIVKSYQDYSRWIPKDAWDSLIFTHSVCPATGDYQSWSSYKEDGKTIYIIVYVLPGETFDVHSDHEYQPLSLVNPLSVETNTDNVLFLY